MEENLDWLEPPTLEDTSPLPVCRVQDFSDALELAQRVREKEPFVLNTEDASADMARRILDFLSGAVFLAGGNIRRLTMDHFLITPPED